MKKLQFFGFAVVIAAALVFSACANGDYEYDGVTPGEKYVLTLEKGKKWSFTNNAADRDELETSNGYYKKVDKEYYFIYEAKTVGGVPSLGVKETLFATGVKKGKTLVFNSGSYTKASVDGVETIEIVGELED
ncbi:MAG: hypothetical protein Ta2F_18160 [Termitinemataceae bacterium]|nr:MAG: hypothetical protein Ta2F_18160 [Termitinemataceae bacterium]